MELTQITRQNNLRINHLLAGLLFLLWVMCDFGAPILPWFRLTRRTFSLAVEYMLRRLCMQGIELACRRA